MSSAQNQKTAADDLLAFIEASPTPFHAVAEVIRRLEARGYRRFDETRSWDVKPGDRVYVERADSSIAAFRMGSVPPAEGGFRLVGAHTDSPNLRLKPRPAYTRAGVRQFGVEVYGGVLLHTWLDRDLGIAGRVLARGADGSVRSHLVRVDGPMLRVPSLAIHLNREVNKEGLKLNAQEHLAPMFALEDAGAFDLHAFLLETLRSDGVELDEGSILGVDLSLHDAQPPTRSGRNGEFLHAPRLDNLACCHAGLVALLDAPDDGRETVGIVLFDHEEVGSRSAQGAGGTLLEDCVTRLCLGDGPRRGDELQRAVAGSWLLSCDMAHALHPNYSDRHEPRHRPLLGGGPVLKTNANQSYATDGRGQALFAALCREADVPMQDFVTRTDLPCGGTIGPISAARIGMRTVDVGAPMLSMHSIREMCAARDIEAFIPVLTRFFGRAG
ncbi:MAG TPA: M18 family aminopeptidase [Myxococcaceae bacterium]|nr:M18 family aminopeptidase [Myxococcaceae bacterium]